ncbi:MAG: flagellar hook capping FlgD N-terminal domain-containing protein [Nitrospinota bacterium]
MQVLDSQFIYSKDIEGSQGVKKERALGKDAFLTMLVAQMKNQDPLNPVENTEFTAQLAQFSSLEQMFNVNENLKNIEMIQSSLNNTQAVNIIGKEVKAEGNSVKLSDAKSVPINYKLSSGAHEVKINIYSSRGELLRTISEISKDAGEQSLIWDGKDGKGNSLPDGIYSFMVSARGPSGNEVGVSTLIKGQVTGVSFENGNTLLSIEGQKVSLGSVIEVNDIL